MRILRMTALLLTGLLTACATGPSGKTFDSPLGEWQTTLSWGTARSQKVRMEIIDKTRATHEYRGGRILFTATEDPYKWEGYWVENFTRINPCPELKDGSDAWGATVFEFNETYSEFKGYWDYCGNGESFAWNGYR